MRTPREFVELERRSVYFGEYEYESSREGVDVFILKWRKKEEERGKMYTHLKYYFARAQRAARICHKGNKAKAKNWSQALLALVGSTKRNVPLLSWQNCDV